LLIIEIFVLSLFYQSKTTMTTINKTEFNETKSFLQNGGILQNDAAGYQILIRKDNTRIFYINGSFKFFKNEDAFIRAAIRTNKRGY
jgi:hypothetical protein